MVRSEQSARKGCLISATTENRPSHGEVALRRRCEPDVNDGFAPQAAGHHLGLGASSSGFLLLATRFPRSSETRVDAFQRRKQRQSSPSHFKSRSCLSTQDGSCVSDWMLATCLCSVSNFAVAALNTPSV